MYGIIFYFFQSTGQKLFWINVFEICLSAVLKTGKSENLLQRNLQITRVSTAYVNICRKQKHLYFSLFTSSWSKDFISYAFKKRQKAQGIKSSL